WLWLWRWLWRWRWLWGIKKRTGAKGQIEKMLRSTKPEVNLHRIKQKSNGNRKKVIKIYAFHDLPHHSEQRQKKP
ncbi:MAG: hypothetical protein J6T08_01215, partial [Lentisphaeria bacterium]|nr:hypothetical protein [Lentisphaeria bacterium]